MFFVSEEFLRKYESGEGFEQTIDQAYNPGEGLFDNYITEEERNRAQKE